MLCPAVSEREAKLAVAHLRRTVAFANNMLNSTLPTSLFTLTALQYVLVVDAHHRRAVVKGCG